jgi:hypothetical protein
LLTASGHRNSCALDDALTRPDVTLPVLNELVNRRLLAYEDRHHTRRVELTHDVLVPVIKASRDSRLTREALAQAERLREEQVAQRRKQRVTLAVACALAIALIATVWGGYYFFVQEHKAYFTDFSKRNGFPVGTIPISEAEARHHAVSYLLVHKGITRDGWRVHWKPAFRMVAVDSRLKPTTTTTASAPTLAARFGHRYRVQRNRRRGAARIVDRPPVGITPTPTARSFTSARSIATATWYSGLSIRHRDQARFRRGWRVLQARTVFPSSSAAAAEYVSIHFDNDGWEDRVTYRDGKNLPAAGPDGASDRT